MIAPIGGENQVNTSTAGNQFASDVSDASSDGSYVVVWVSQSKVGGGDLGTAAGDGSELGVFAQRYGANGAPVGGEFQVNQYVTNAQYNAHVSMLDDGRFVVVWESTGQDGDQGGVYARIYNANGSPAGNEFRVNATTANIQGDPSISALHGANANGFVITWTAIQPGSNGYDIFSQRYDGAGAAVGTETKINTGRDVYYDYGSGVVGLAGGGYAISWRSNDDTFVAQFDASGTAVAGVNPDNYARYGRRARQHVHRL